MGGNPCHLKQLLDGYSALQRGFDCMKNTALIVATVTDGKPPITQGMADDFRAQCEVLAKQCANIESELSPYLPPSD